MIWIIELKFNGLIQLLKLSIEMFKCQLKTLNISIWIFDLGYIRIEKSNYKSYWNDLNYLMQI